MAGDDPPPEGAQLKVNLLLRRLPRLKDRSVDPRAAFAGTLHLRESMADLQDAYASATAGALPDRLSCEVYCHTLSDRSILGPRPRGLGRADADAVRPAHPGAAVRGR